MKYFLFLLLFAYSSLGFSQTEPKSFKDKFEEFEYYAKPNPTNDLSRYFRRHIDSNLLNTYKFKDTVESKNHIYLTFQFNKENKIVAIRVNSPYSELNKNISEAFKDYDIDKLTIPEKSRLNIYALQILSQKGGKMVVNCSSDIVYDRYPIYEGCESMTSNYQMKSCINKLLETHIIKKFSHAVIKKAKVLGSLTLKPEFIINGKGVVELLQSKNPIDSLTIELNRVVALFPNAKTPPLRNGKPSRLTFTGYIPLQIESENKEYLADVIKSKDSTLNPNCDLALHFKNFINENELIKNVFPLSKESVEISFSIDKKGKMIDVNASTGYNPTLNSRLVEIFKKYPIEKLNIKSTNVLETYKYTIITKGYPLNVIQCNETPNVYIPPCFDKNCEKSKSSEELMKYFYEKINEIIVRNISKSLYSKTELTKGFFVFCGFQVDSDAKIIDVKVKAPNPIMANGMEQIIKDTTVYKPAYLNGKAIKSSYSIPIRFNVGYNSN